MKAPLSVVLITGNEESNITACLESVAGWAEEIVVVDSESADQTVAIARKYTDRIIIRRWEGFAAQKQFAMEQAKCEWVLSIDADERVSPELRDAITRELSGNPLHSGYRVPRRNHFLGKWIRSCFWYPDYQLRLFRRKDASVTRARVHEGFVVNGETGMLKGDLIHFTYRSLDEALRKINSYSSLAAEDRVSGKRIGVRHIILHPVAAFLTDFVSRKGYRDGMHGFLVSFLNALTNFMMYAKLWEQIAKKKTIPNYEL
jgi:glycosyltransferase involved in cell wall biosynthesis